MRTRTWKNHKVGDLVKAPRARLPTYLIVNDICPKGYELRYINTRYLSRILWTDQDLEPTTEIERALFGTIDET